MIGKRTITFIVPIYILFSIVLLMSACGSKKLMDIDKTSDFLTLSEEQLQVVQPKVETIKIIVDKYNAEKEKIETELQELRSSRMAGGGYGGRGGSGGGRSVFRGKLEALHKKQAQSQGLVDTLVADIKDVLDEDQLEKFEKVELPKLEIPEFGGGRQRGGKGGGRRGGGGRGGRGGRGGIPPF